MSSCTRFASAIPGCVTPRVSTVVDSVTTVYASIEGKWDGVAGMGVFVRAGLEERVCYSISE